MKRAAEKFNQCISFADRMPLWWVGILLLAAAFAPILFLGEGSVFEIHDQMDESMLNYVLTARHWGEGLDVFPEMFHGVNASGMQPAAVLFLPLYRIFPAFTAFVLQYAICFLCGFFGMYLCIKELAGSSILAVCGAGCFCMLPMYPIYGLTEYGIPLILYAGICLWKGNGSGGKRIFGLPGKVWLGLALTALFGFTSHLVCTGYVVLGFWALAIFMSLIQKTPRKWLISGFLELLVIYLIVNRSLFLELLLGNSAYISHREEMVSYAQPFWQTAEDVFVNSAQHAPSLHKYLILPILLLLAAGAFLKKNDAEKKLYRAAVWGMGLLAGMALFYAFCKSAPVVAFKNSVTGFLHYFQAERFYWLYPAGWYLEFALIFAVWWKKAGRTAAEGEEGLLLRTGLNAGRIFSLALLLLPTVNLIQVNSYFYRNVNQINNGSGITGYVTWESYYAEDLMKQLEQAIGRDMSTYRVAHLGVSPAPSLMHGFYTVDGYSNNYPMEYKHAFRKVIERELAKNPETKQYFDEWGNRCYLFNSITGTYYSVAKNAGIQYEGLEFDMEALRELGCEYLFSGGEILDAERMGLESMGYFETENSYWGIWLYRLE